MMYFIGRAILRSLFKIFFRLKIEGSGNCPQGGPLILAPNHASFLDPIIAGLAVKRELNFMARDTLFRNRVFRWILRSVNAFPLRREGADLSAMKLAVDKLRQGNAVLIFPEGTRTSDGNLGEPRTGIGFLAAASGAQVLPCYIKGSMEALPRGAVLPRFKSISVYVGRPLKFTGDVSGRDAYDRIASETMKAISDLKDKAKTT